MLTVNVPPIKGKLEEKFKREIPIITIIAYFESITYGLNNYNH